MPISVVSVAEFRVGDIDRATGSVDIRVCLESASTVEGINLIDVGRVVKLISFGCVVCIFAVEDAIVPTVIGIVFRDLEVVIFSVVVTVMVPDLFEFNVVTLCVCIVWAISFGMGASGTVSRASVVILDSSAGCVGHIDDTDE